MTPEQLASLEHTLTRAPVIPVMVIEDVAAAVPLARALVAGGLTVLEITLRTRAAVQAAEAIKAEVEGAIVGVGTVLTEAQLTDAERIGAAFAVSPGATPRLLDAARDSAVPLLPGAATPAETMVLLERGYGFQKFFPAEALGGAAYLSSLQSPFPQVQFCPTGGITPEIAPSYLKLKNVICIGGSWMAPKSAVEAGDWAGIEAAAKKAAGLRA